MWKMKYIFGVKAELQWGEGAGNLRRIALEHASKSVEQTSHSEASCE